MTVSKRERSCTVLYRLQNESRLRDGALQYGCRTITGTSQVQYFYSTSIVRVVHVAQVLELFVLWQDVVRVTASCAEEVGVQVQEFVEARRPIITIADYRHALVHGQLRVFESNEAKL